MEPALTISTKKISLGLQGGGTYGAFTWGVLDRLLQDERIEITSLSGVSAGAVNAAVVADGFAHGGGREGARLSLSRFWHALGLTALLSPLQRTPLDHMVGGFTMSNSPFYHLMEMAGALAGPVREQPLTANPLRQFLTTNIDFERVRACKELGIFINATNLHTGAGKLFRREEIDVQRVMASACLPTVFASVEVEGELYWDGSYTANPPLAPLVKEGGASDLLVVQINPIVRTETPGNVADISNRANEIAFNISFVREVNALLHVQGVSDEEGGSSMLFSTTRLHMISALNMLSEFSISSKFNSELGFLEMLHNHGVAAADKWLKEHFDDLGVRTTLDTKMVFAF